MHALDPAGDDIHVLGRMQRHRHAAHQSDLARPLAGAIDDDFGSDRSLIRFHAGHRAIGDGDSADADALDDAGATVARAFRQRLRQIGRIGLAVTGQPDGARQVVDGHYRPEILGFLR
ncbi:hypothetical protein D3C87_1359780 [compost metagenome]